MKAGGTARSTPALVVCGWALLLAVWVMANPPFAAPDESAHYLRALEAGRGRLITRAAPELAVSTNERQLAWIRGFTRAIEIPPNHAPLPIDCYILHRDRSAACIDRFVAPSTATRGSSYTGNYPPLPYVLAGPLARAGDDPAEALRLGRAPLALATLLLLGIAAWALWDRAAGALSLLGPMLAVTPMVIYCWAALNGSALEVAGGVAFFATLLRLTRHVHARAPARVWAAMAVSGAVLASSRTLGPVWVVLMLGLAVLLAGPRSAWALVRRDARAAGPSLGVVVLAIVAAGVWEARYGGGSIVSLESLRAVIGDSFTVWWTTSSDLVGKFSYLEYRLPSAIYVAWFALGFGAIWLGLRAGERRERRALALAAAFAFAFPIAMWVAAVRFTGFGMQGRYVLPVLVAVPLLAGEVVYRRRDRLSGAVVSALAVGVPLVVGALQFLAVWFAGRRVAVGTDGPVLWVGSADWSPPGGWAVWLVLALVGSGCVASAGWSARRAA